LVGKREEIAGEGRLQGKDRTDVDNSTQRTQPAGLVKRTKSDKGSEKKAKKKQSRNERKYTREPKLGNAVARKCN